MSDKVLIYRGLIERIAEHMKIYPGYSEKRWADYNELRAILAAPRQPDGDAELREECERLRMQLAACGVVALSNTSESAAEARQMHPDYMSASCSDVANAVDREMAMRQQRDKLAGLLREVMVEYPCALVMGEDMAERIDAALDEAKP